VCDVAKSTGLVATAGLLVITNDLVNGPWDVPKEVKRLGATVIAAFVTAGIDVALPGLGTGLAVILVLTAAISVGPPLLNKLFPKE
jgi:hypothetical protein